MAIADRLKELHNDELVRTQDEEQIFSLVADGDCSRLKPDQRTKYYLMRCEAAGIDPRTQPFEFIKLNGKLQLYARKGCTDQLSMKHGLTFSVTEAKVENDLYVVIGTAGNGARSIDDIGAVSVQGLKGENLANAMMKALTKCRRRAVLSWCGLGMVDESEVEGVGRPIVTKAIPAAPTVGSADGSGQAMELPPAPGDEHAPSTSEPAAEEAHQEQGEGGILPPPTVATPDGPSVFDSIMHDLVLTVPGELGRVARLQITKKVVTAQKEGQLTQGQVDMLRSAYKAKETP